MFDCLGFLKNQSSNAALFQLAQKSLLNQLKRNKLHVKSTIDDLRVANNDLDVQQKRVNREYESEIEDRAKWAEIRKRKL